MTGEQDAHAPLSEMSTCKECGTPCFLKPMEVWHVLWKVGSSSHCLATGPIVRLALLVATSITPLERCIEMWLRPISSW